MVGNRNNLLPLEAMSFIGLYPIDTGRGTGLPPLVSKVRLFNKYITPQAHLGEVACTDMDGKDTDCKIPKAFLNDDFCDCPETCSDEKYHTCDTCKTPPAPGFTFDVDVSCEFCNSLALNGDTDSTEPYSCLEQGSASNQPFECPSHAGKPTCQIDPVFVNDNRCDCPDCGDEENWDCSTCPCPTECGLSLYECDKSGVHSCSSADTGQECNIPQSLVGDGTCNCPGTCDDEVGYDFTCESCRCPIACGQKLVLSCLAERIWFEFPPYSCNGGCLIAAGYVNNSVCDCPQCDDEVDWDCSTCPCPSGCDDVTVGCTSVYYQCPELGCPISPQEVNDNFCDCPDCSDEDHWTCEESNQKKNNNRQGQGGHQSQARGQGPQREECTFKCEESSCGQTNPCNLSIFECETSGCQILGLQRNNNVCDCPGCEDEDEWSCTTCTCPDDCPTMAGIELVLLAKTQARCGGLADRVNPSLQLQCPGGDCPITADQMGDGLCDCPGTCADEPDCSSIPAASCGSPVPCTRRLQGWNYKASEASLVREFIFKTLEHFLEALDVCSNFRYLESLPHSKNQCHMS